MFYRCSIFHLILRACEPFERSRDRAIWQHSHLTLRSAAQRSVSKGGYAKKAAQNCGSADVPRRRACCHPSRHSLRSFLRVRWVCSSQPKHSQTLRSVAKRSVSKDGNAKNGAAAIMRCIGTVPVATLRDTPLRSVPQGEVGVRPSAERFTSSQGEVVELRFGDRRSDSIDRARSPRAMDRRRRTGIAPRR
jgi:hypothetical protein